MFFMVPETKALALHIVKGPPGRRALPKLNISVLVLEFGLP